MRHLILVLTLMLPVFAEPGVAVVFDPRQPGQSQLAGKARDYLSKLIRQNALADHQFTVKLVDLSTPEGRRFRSQYELTDADLPALACYEREGNRLRLRSLVRAYRHPLEAAQTAFARIQLEEPRLIASSRLFTGVTLATDPPGVRVAQGPVELGVTPCRVALTPGRSQLTLTHPDFVAQTVELQLQTGEVLERSLALAPAPSRVTIRSSGPPLEVVMDGHPLGTTPITLATTAGQRRLQARAPGFQTLDVEFRAPADGGLQVVLKPTPQQVRIGLGEVTADGYLMGRGFDSLPSPTGGVELSGADYARQLQARMGLVAEGDCTVNLDVNAWETYVKAELTILDREGRTLQTLVAKRGLPLIAILDEEGSARRTGAALVDELSSEAVRWIRANISPGPLSEEEQRSSVQVLAE